MPPARAAATALFASAVVVLLASASACQTAPSGSAGADQQRSKGDGLRAFVPAGLHLGSAVAGGGHHLTAGYADPFTHDSQYREELVQHFTSVTAENQMKWIHLRPDRDTYDFADADAIVDFAERHNQVVRGHTLLWHNQNPDWLKDGEFTADELREILRDHIHTVVGRYAGKIHQWDVANEIIDDQAELRTHDNIFIRELGPEIVADAFRWAHEADPTAELFLNDYSVEGVNAKSDAYYAMAQELLAQEVPLHGFGVQGHLDIRWDFPNSMEANLRRFDDLGLATAVTEVDVRMDLPEVGEPTDAQLEKQADYYRRALEACLAVEGCRSFTLWGFNDVHSWVPGFFAGQGAANIMTEDYSLKPAFFALRDALEVAG